MIPILACSIVVLAVVAGVFFLKWRKLALEWERIALRLPFADHQHLSLKGYYFKNLQKENEEISPGLKAVFNLPESINSLAVLLSLLTKQSAARLEDVIGRLSHANAQSPHSYSITLRTNAPKLSQRLYFDAVASMVFDRKGRGKGIIIWFRDVTLHAQQKKRLKLENHQLKEECIHYSNILHAMPFPIWQRDEQLTIRFYNLAFSALLEEDPANPVAVELSKQTRSLAQEAMLTRTALHERQHLIVEGARRLFEISEIPIPETQSQAGFAYDITDKEELEDDLERHLAAQACLLESSASAMALFGFDTRIKLYNNAYLKLWGLDENWLATHPTYGEVLELLREKRKLPEQANFPAFKKQQMGLFTDLMDPYNEFFYLPDGSALRVIVIPHALGGLLFAYEDMTDKLAMERSYNTLIAVQRATLDNLHEAVAVFGQNGRLKLSNPTYAKLWRLDLKMLETEPHISHILEHTRHLYRYGNDWGAFKEETITQATNRQPIQQCFERTDGKVLEWIGVPLPDGAILMTYLDVTDSTLVARSLQERNEALVAADKLKTEFLANVSYELRSPLTSIIGFTEILKNYYKDGLQEKELGYIEAVYKSSQYLMTLINDILDLASIEAGFMKLNLNRFNICNMLNSVGLLVKQRVKENHLTFRIRCDNALGTMLGDEIRIKQVVFKLMSNAIKFSHPKGTIILGADFFRNDEIVIWVEDRGIGIPPEEQPKVFDKFYKVQSVRSNEPGTGLGLSVVKNFVQLHGGRVEVKSQVGVGTKFSCYFRREDVTVLEGEEVQ